jgi:hypothetical protein
MNGDILPQNKHILCLYITICLFKKKLSPIGEELLVKKENLTTAKNSSILFFRNKAP